jgi:hypothetical protein
MRLKLTPGQSCYLHGWLSPKPTLSWADVRGNPSLTLQHLLAAGLALDELHGLQPEVSEWVKAGRVTLADCPAMAELWGGHPVRDFKADLGDIAGFKWTAEAMLKMGLNYAELVDIGLTPASMIVFTHVTLHGWSQLGFTRADAAQVPEPVLIALFCMPKQEVLRSLK